MSQPVFKCADNPKHVQKVKLTREDVTNALGFFELFKIPTSRSIEAFKETIAVASEDEVHDIAHELFDDLIAAYDKGENEGALFLGPDIINELRLKQEQCRLGTEE